MKKTILALLFLAFPASAGTYSITTTANQDGVLAKAMARANKATCRYFGQPVGCTQVSVRREFCRRNGIGGVTTCVPGALPTDPPICTTTPLVSDCSGATQFDIFPDVQKFLDREVVRLVKEEYGPKNAQENASEIQRLVESGTQAQKDNFCLAAGLPAGCLYK